MSFRVVVGQSQDTTVEKHLLFVCVIFSKRAGSVGCLEGTTVLAPFLSSK